MKKTKDKIIPIIAIIFGIIILLKPEIIAIVIALYLIFYGLSELLMEK